MPRVPFGNFCQRKRCLPDNSADKCSNTQFVLHPTILSSSGCAAPSGASPDIPFIFAHAVTDTLRNTQPFLVTHNLQLLQRLDMLLFTLCFHILTLQPPIFCILLTVLKIILGKK